MVVLMQDQPEHPEIKHLQEMSRIDNDEVDQVARKLKEAEYILEENRKI